MLMFYAYFTLATCSTGDVISLSTWRFVFYGIFVERRSSISNVYFFVLSKRWSPILLSKL